MSAKPPRQLHLNANIIAAGRHAAGWRQHTPPILPSDVGHFIAIAKAAEAATFDAIFFSDQPGLAPDAIERPWTSLDPTILLAALARETRHLGLVATASTTLEQPYNLARRFASLAHVSGGRVAWNIVTTHHAGVAGNHGLVALPEHAARYARADEFVDLVKRLWASWETGAIQANVETGEYLDLGKIQPVSYQGEFFSHEGRFNVPPPPGGRPVLFQAGDSQASRNLGARHADALFTVQRTLADGQAFRRDLHERARHFGRDPADLRILPGLLVVLGDTEQAAHRNKEALDAQLDITREHQKLARLFGVGIERLPLDEPLPDGLLRDWSLTQTQGFAAGLINEAHANGWTVRQAIARNPGGHRVVIGTPEQVADDLELWFDEGAADGFNLNFEVYPGDLVTFAEQVVPLLRQRGIFRSAYDGSTLHQHLGLASI